MNQNDHRCFIHFLVDAFLVFFAAGSLLTVVTVGPYCAILVA